MTVTAPLVSVVIPVRNRSTEVVRAIETIMAQGMPVDIIVVDDASTDDTPDVVERLSLENPSVRLVRLPVNRGGGHARNVGIDAACADWLAFLDSDDEWAPNKLARQFETLKDADPTNVLCFTNLSLDWYDGRGVRPWNDRPFSPDTVVKDYLIEQDQVVQTSTILMSTAAARRIRFADHLRRHQDIDFVLRCAAGGVEFVYCDESLVHYASDPAADRVSSRRNAMPSLGFIKAAPSYLSRRDVDRFYLKHVFDMHYKQAPIRATHYLISAMVRRSEPVPRLTRRWLQEVLTPEMMTRVKKMLNKA